MWLLHVVSTARELQGSQDFLKSVLGSQGTHPEREGQAVAISPVGDLAPKVPGIASALGSGWEQSEAPTRIPKQRTKTSHFSEKGLLLPLQQKPVDMEVYLQRVCLWKYNMNLLLSHLKNSSHAQGLAQISPALQNLSCSPRASCLLQGPNSTLCLCFQSTFQSTSEMALFVCVFLETEP